MPLGGGLFLTQNKVLPGSYINFISAARASATLSERGYAAIPIELDWGVDGEVFTVEVADFQKQSLKLFGYAYTHEKLKGLRDLFLNIRTGYFYKLNTGGVKASCIYANALYTGIRDFNPRFQYRKRQLHIVITKPYLAIYSIYYKKLYHK